MHLDLPHSPAAQRNGQPILDQLSLLLPPRGKALEIASGTGQHVELLAGAMPGWMWQPSDADAGALPAIAARCAAAGLPNAADPVRIDVTQDDWFPGREAPDFDAVFCANMLHIAPWQACQGLLRGAARYLASGGLLVTYGPYWEGDVPAAPSNLAFDASLRERDPAWGIRSLEAVRAQAADAGLELQERISMPANNLLLVFRKLSAAPTPG